MQALSQSRGKKVSMKKLIFYIILISTMLLVACASYSTQVVKQSAKPVTVDTLQVGAERTELYLPTLAGKNVGLVVNHTSTVDEQHLVDFLLAKGVQVKAIYSPEHGFRGNHDAGAKVASEFDQQSGLPIFSVYGKTKKPSKEMLKGIDVLVFDIQDVGVRFYTYISTMHYIMEAAAEHDIAVVVLDRPNPNGQFVDGPILEPEFQSFVGMHPIPVLHGMTVAELAQMINGEGWLKDQVKADLKVIPVANYSRTQPYILPIKPSPNLPNAQSINLYPSLCFFEATPVSIGRGTDFPFQVAGHDEVTFGEFEFIPRSMPGAASNPKLKGKVAKGVDLRNSSQKGLDLGLLLHVSSLFKQQGKVLFTQAQFMDKLAGTDKLRKQIDAGLTEPAIRKTWQLGLHEFKQRRQPYLLYQD